MLMLLGSAALVLKTLLLLLLLLLLVVVLLLLPCQLLCTPIAPVHLPSGWCCCLLHYTSRSWCPIHRRAEPSNAVGVKPLGRCVKVAVAAARVCACCCNHEWCCRSLHLVLVAIG